MNNEVLKKAISLIKSGDKSQGGKILANLVKNDPENELAWLWLSACFTDIEQKRYCLNKVLEINPDNLQARNQLDKLTISLNRNIKSSYLPEIESKSNESVQKQGNKLSLRAILYIILFSILGCFFLFYLLNGGVASNHEVTYKANVLPALSPGIGLEISVTEVIGGVENSFSRAVGFPWERTITAETGDFVSVTVFGNEFIKDITCEVWVDGKLWKRTQDYLSGSYQVVSCVGYIGTK